MLIFNVINIDLDKISKKPLNESHFIYLALYSFSRYTDFLFLLEVVFVVFFLVVSIDPKWFFKSFCLCLLIVLRNRRRRN